jgi:L-asparagine oxygenase
VENTPVAVEAGIETPLISDVVRDRIATLASTVTGDPYRQADEFASQCAEASAFLPEDLARPLDLLAGHRGPIALVLRGVVSIPALVATPTIRFEMSGVGAIGTEAHLAILGSRLGSVFAFREWDRGHLVQNRYPIAAHAAIQAASGSTGLVLHTEASFADLSPEHLAIIGVRVDPTGTARTTVASTPRALSMLAEEDRQALRQPSFAFETDSGCFLVDGRRTTEPRPLLREEGGVWRLEFSESLFGVDAPAADVLARLRSALTSTATSVVLVPGDVLLVDNWRAVHGRTPFRPRFDGTDRWIQRVLVRSAMPGDERVVPDSRFSQYPSAYRQALSRPS